MKGLILVVDEEPGTRRLARFTLEPAGYVVRDCEISDVFVEAESSRPCVMLVADALPGEFGLGLCRTIRQNPSLAGTRIILLITGGGEEKRRAARDAGADDCISKPFSAGELSSCVEGVLRGVKGPSVPVFEPSEVLIDRAAMKLSIRGQEVTTTSLEFRLVDYLAQHRGRVCTRDVLLDAVWGEMQFVTPRSVDACIRRLRDKIELDRTKPVYLKTVRGVGYRFDANVVWPTFNPRCTCRACLGPVEQYGPAPVATSKNRKMAVHA